MSGMNAKTGRALEGIEHIKQSVADILSTPIGSRVMRRDYGSLLPELIDQPLNGATLLRAYAAVVTALTQWEPRVYLTRIVYLVNSEHPGTTVLEMDIIRLDQPQQGVDHLSIEIPLGRAA